MKKSTFATTDGGLGGMGRRNLYERPIRKIRHAIDRPLTARLRRLLGRKTGWQRLRKSGRAKLAGLMPWKVFLGEWLRSPRKIGAICPSGPILASVMARQVPAGNGLVVELGAGTGAVTEALLRNGVAADRLVAVEQSPALAACLRQRFPHITVIEGDAAALSQILPDEPVDCIVSSIPLVSLPESMRQAIIREIKETLRGKRLIQYTYLWGGALLEKSGLQPLTSHLVLRNIPPAKVMTFATEADDGGDSGCR